MADTVEKRLLGFSGGGAIDGIPVLITAGSAAVEISPSYVSPMSIPHPSSGGGPYRGQVYIGDGTAITNGSLSFDMTTSSAQLVKVLSSRGKQFDVVFTDGTNGSQMKKCVASSVSATGSVNGIVTASVSFMCGSEWTDTGGPGNWLREHELTAYWASGNTNVRDWSFSFNTSLEPVYLNNKSYFPAYIKCGMSSVSLQMTCFERELHERVVISTSGFQLTGIVTSDGYNFGGTGDIGTYVHTFTGTASLDEGSDAVVLRCRPFLIPES